MDAFGFGYELYDKLYEYDVCVVIGHEPFKPVRARHYLLYTFYPDDTRLNFDDVRAILAISQYSAHWVGEKWGYAAHRLYPPVRSIGVGPLVDMEQRPDLKENIILAVCRADPYKAPLWMAERFIEFGFEGWEFHLVLARTDMFTDYEQQVTDYFAEHDNLVLHQHLYEEDLRSLYQRSRIFWHAKGLLAENNPQEAEHFGLVPIEAASAGCIPIVYDLGGHRETVIPSLRWKNADSLKRITEEAMQWQIVSCREPLFNNGVEIISPLEDIETGEHRYVKELEWWIRRVNALAVELQRKERIEVKERKIRIAGIADSPRLTTGFGIVVNEIYKRIP